MPTPFDVDTVVWILDLDSGSKIYNAQLPAPYEAIAYLKPIPKANPQWAFIAKNGTLIERDYRANAYACQVAAIHWINDHLVSELDAAFPRDTLGQPLDVTTENEERLSAHEEAGYIRAEISVPTEPLVVEHSSDAVMERVHPEEKEKPKRRRKSKE